MRIKVSLLKSKLHECDSFTDSNLSFIKGIEKELNNPIMISELEDYDCDIKLIFIASGGSEGLFLNNLSSLKPPYYLLTSGNNNSLAASLEILTYLNEHLLPGEVLHGSNNYIAKRIKELTNVNNDGVVRLGVIGKPSDWLIASIPNYQKVYDKFHIELVDISLDEVVNEYLETSLTKVFSDNSEVEKANILSDTLEKIVNKYDLKGFTIRCFDLLDKIHMTGCLGLAKLNQKGIIATCEGDIMTMITMYLIKSKYGLSSFQANPSKIDVENKEVVFAHCTIPLDMVDSYRYMTHFESKIGIAIKGELPLNEVTIVRMNKNLQDCYVNTGKIVANLNEDNLCRTQIKVKFDSDISSLLKNPCGNHHVIFFGKHYEL